MVKRRRTSRNVPRRKSQKRKSPAGRKRRTKDKSLKEKFLTSAIWGLSLINIFLIISLVSNFFASPNEVSVNPKVDLSDIDETITVEVLNACGVQGLANQMTQYLRNKNFDVVNVGNYKGGFDLEKTFVFDRVSMGSIYAQKVAAVLGVDEDQVAPQLDDSMQLMVTVLIGKDYKNLKIFEDSEK